MVRQGVGLVGHRHARLVVASVAAMAALVTATGVGLPGGDSGGDANRRIGVVAGSAAEPTPPARVWARLADCESGDAAVAGSARWNAATGNGYFGGLQFSRTSWAEVGGAGEPHLADRDHQIEMARRLHRRQGFGAWPACARRLGLPVSRAAAG